MENGIEQLFEKLAYTWIQETAFMSSPTRIVAHPACRSIVSLGRNVLNLVLRKIEDDVNVGWLEVIAEITGESPIPKEDFGYVLRMRDHWLAWARKNNINWRG